MTTFIIEGFGGKDMKHDPRRIPENKAQVATDCELERGSLHPLAADPNAGVGTTTSAAVCMYWYKRETWLGWSEETDAVKLPIANDKWNRIAITKEGQYPVQYTEGASYRLGIPAPEVALSVSPTQPPPVDETELSKVDVETCAYVYTFVDSFGAEGPPSPPSVWFDRVVDTDVNLVLPGAPSGNYNFGTGAVKRIYRSSNAANTAHFLFAGEIPIAQGSATDSVPGAALAEVLPSDTWVGPPDDNGTLYPDGPMVGICQVANGILAGFSHQTVCFSEPFLPHAWPFEYRITLEDPIVGICSIAAGLLVVTEFKPYLVSGVHPASMALTQIDESQGLISARGLVDMGTYAIYPSADGLVLVEGATARVVTSDIITYEDWKVYQPETIEAYHEEGKYVAFYGGDRGFVFDPRDQANAFIDHNRYYKAGYHDGPTGKLLLNSGGAIVSWGDNTDLSSSSAYTWRSKKEVMRQACNFSALRVEAWESFVEYPVTAKVYADGVLTDTVEFNDAEANLLGFRRLSDGFRGKVWEFELTGKNPISFAGLFETMSEVV